MIAGRPDVNLTACGVPTEGGAESIVEAADRGGRGMDRGRGDVVEGPMAGLFFAFTSSTARIAISSGSHSVPGQCCVTSCGFAVENEPPAPPRTLFSGWRMKSAWFELGV